MMEMSLPILRSCFRAVLKTTGLLSAARTCRNWMKFLTDRKFRYHEKLCRQEFNEFKRLHGELLRVSINRADRLAKKVLVVSSGMLEVIKVELALIKAFELAGYRPIVLTYQNPQFLKYYELVGISEFVFWEDFLEPAGSALVEHAFERIQSFEDLMRFNYSDTRAGKYAASTALRYLRLGHLDLSSDTIRRSLLPYLRSSMEYAVAASSVVQSVRPQIALSMDPGYTPRGELFDACLTASVDTITWNAAHKNNTLMLKRYSNTNRDVHPASLSEETWNWLKRVHWTDDRRKRLQEELYRSYASGDWYSEVGTQFNTRLFETDELREQFSLDPSKKTAVIFPHIFWDGTFFWGTDLFESYEAWFLETVRAACSNTRVNWIIKVHPGNVVKNARDGIWGEPSEVTAIREHFGQFPPHLTVVAADSLINTFSLFPLMDYCLTVRGTIGIEAASFGIQAITAGTGRYDHKGFTIDSESREQYLERIANIQHIPPLSAAQRELAERFSYGLFVLRPFPLTSVTLEYKKDAKASCHTRINRRTKEEWINAEDLKAFAQWIDSGREDFIALDDVMLQHYNFARQHSSLLNFA